MAPERSGFVSANMLYMKNKQKTYITTGSKRAIAMMMPHFVYDDLSRSSFRVGSDSWWGTRDIIRHRGASNRDDIMRG